MSRARPTRPPSAAMGELNARFEGLGGWDTDTAVNKVANGLSISDEMRTRPFDRAVRR